MSSSSSIAPPSDGWGVDLLRAALEAIEEGAATDRPEWRNICAVDLNFGCPAPAICVAAPVPHSSDAEVR